MNNESPFAGKKIILTGGGTAGHVSPNIALIPRLKELGFEVEYIGSYDGIEKQLIAETGVPYHGISSGKLRRYRSLKNLSDPFRVLKGYFQAKKLLKQLKPDIVFSKGGFVSVPVVIAAGRKKIPCVIHECDMTPGLANKLAIPFAARVCTNFAETVDKIKGGKAVHTGTPIRESLAQGSKEEGLKLCGFNEGKPVIMVTGGSLGAGAINDAIREAIVPLTESYQVIHLCGKGKKDEKLERASNYHQIEYAGPEMKDLYAAADPLLRLPPALPALTDPAAGCGCKRHLLFRSAFDRARTRPVLPLRNGCLSCYFVSSMIMFKTACKPFLSGA